MKRKLNGLKPISQDSGLQRCFLLAQLVCLRAQNILYFRGSQCRLVVFEVRVLGMRYRALKEAWERKLREREGGENTKGTAHLKAGKAGSPRPT